MGGRKSAQLHKLDQYDFDRLAKTEGSSRERRRFLAFAHLREGKSFTEAAIAVGVKLRSLMRWVKKFRTEGFDRVPYKNLAADFIIQNLNHYSILLLRRLGCNYGCLLYSMERFCCHSWQSKKSLLTLMDVFMTLFLAIGIIL